MDRKMEWSHAIDEMLIEMVKIKPELYDLSSVLYTDNVMKKRSWNEIGRQLGCEGIICKERWESLRAQYRKQKTKRARGGQSATNKFKWKYDDQMSFLLKCIKPKKRASSALEPDGEFDGMSSEVEFDGINSDVRFQGITCDVEFDNAQGKKESEDSLDFADEQPQLRERVPCKRKMKENDTSSSDTPMKYLVEKKKEDRAPEPIDTFFSLMADTVKKFIPADQHFIKTKVFLLVNEMEGKYIQYQSKRNEYQEPATSSALSHSTTPSPNGQSVQHHQEHSNEASPPLNPTEGDSENNFPFVTEFKLEPKVELRY